jgi:hypothetical protein
MVTSWDWLSIVNFLFIYFFGVCGRCILEQEQGMVEQINKFQLKMAWEVKDI